MTRQVSSTVTRLHVECLGCSWTADSANALGLAARHHDHYGHAVRVEVDRVVVYGDPSRPTIPGQTDLLTELAAQEASP
jgi:hypothetical protein